ncbi:hypothetical protein KAI87_12060 [Myxococcota bacterium]|nr:hypothetical protein [Myxococcota bacterium]
MHLGPKKLRNALSMRLVGLLVATTMLVTATNVIINLESSERHWLHLVESCAHRTNELVRRATHYGMLLNRKEDVARLINDVAASEGVHSLRVFDKLGKISFSSNPEEIGQLVDMSAESCSGCHAGGGRVKRLRSTKTGFGFLLFQVVRGLLV